MRFFLASARCRSHSAPLLLFGVGACLFYQTLMVAWNRLQSGLQQPSISTCSRKSAGDVLMEEEETQRFISALEALQRQLQVSPPGVCVQ